MKNTIFIWTSSINTLFFLGFFVSHNFNTRIMAVFPLLISLPLIVMGVFLIMNTKTKKLHLVGVSLAELMAVVPIILFIFNYYFHFN